MNADELLQNKLEELECGTPLDEVIASLPCDAKDLAVLLRLANALRLMPFPDSLQWILNRYRSSRIQ